MMKPTNTLIMLLFVFLASGAVCSYGVPEWSVKTVTTNAASLAYDCRRPMSAGLYDATVGKTFICFTGTGMVPLVAAYDHTSGTWGAPLAVNIPDTSTDYHDYSHIFMSADGHIHVTYSRHNLSLWIASSENPHSIAGTWNVREIGSDLKATYPMPIKGSDGTLYILYRVSLSPTDYRPIKWVKSTDNGATWSAPVSCIDSYNSRTDNLNEVYMGQMIYEPAHPSFGEGYSASWTLAGGGPTEHDHNNYHKNMYYAFFSMSNAHWRAADGTDLGVNIDDFDAETYCKVYDSGSLEGNAELGEVQDIGYTSAAACDANGYPVVAFQNGKDNSIDIGHWDGISWNVNTPPTFEGTRGLRDMARIDGAMWLLEIDGTGNRVVELNGTNWTDVAAYHPELTASEAIFIDDAQSEVMIFTARDTERIYSAGYNTTEPPQLVSAQATHTTLVEIVFNEWVEPGSATDTANYVIDNGISVIDATLSTYKTVNLTVSEMTIGSNYTVTVNNITNQVGLAIVADSQAVFTVYPPDPPSVTTLGATTVAGAMEADLKGILGGDSPAELYVVWDTVDHGTNLTAWTSPRLLSAQPPGLFSISATGLVAEVEYVYRCFASNTYGTAWSDAEPFSVSVFNYVKIEDFESRTLNAAIAGQGDWGGDTTSVDEFSVRIDPDDPGNQVLWFNQGVDKEVYLNSPALRITNNTTSTLFFRMRGLLTESGAADLWLRQTLSDVSAPTAFSDGETDMALADDGAGNLTLTGVAGTLVETNWYRVWIVADTAIDTFDTYVQREGGVQHTALAGQVFRNGAGANDLVSFMLKVNNNDGAGSNGDAWFDDLYVAHGQDAHGYSPVGPDQDLDGVPDQWEWDYFGSLSVSSGLPSDDQDGDGFSDLSEYFAGTVPTNAASLLKVSVALAGSAPNDTILSWQSVLDKVYFVESTTNLVSGTWTTDPLPIGGIPPFCTYTTQVDNAATFFRIKLDH